MAKPTPYVYENSPVSVLAIVPPQIGLSST